MMPLARGSKLRPISSMANTIPASGVLNAAATLAAPPARMVVRMAFSLWMPSLRPSECVRAAPIWMIGPS